MSTEPTDPTPTDPTPIAPDLAQIAALNTAVVEADAAIVAARHCRGECGSRREALLSRLADVRAKFSVGDGPEVNTDIIHALAADPMMEHAPETLAAATERHTAYRLARDARQTEIALLEQAIGKLDSDLSGMDVDVARITAQREQAWQAFLTAAHQYLIAQFQERFATLRRELLDPLVDMQRMELPGRAGTDEAPTVHARSLIGFGSTRLDRRSRIEFDRALSEDERKPGRSSIETTVAFEWPGGSLSLRATEAIDRFRASLDGGG